MFLLILGLVILGPEKLPTVLRKMGRFYGEFKRMTNDAQSAASEYKSVFQDAAGEIADDSPEPDFVPWQPPTETSNDSDPEPISDEATSFDSLSPDDDPQISVISYEDKN